VLQKLSASISRWALSAYFYLIVFYLIFPVLIIFPISLSNNTFLRFPPSNFGIRWYQTFVNDPAWMEATILSFSVAISVSILATVIGTMAVLALERRKLRFSNLLSYFMSSPLLIPHIFIALGVLIFTISLGVENSIFALIGAHTAIAIPYVVLIVGASHRQLDLTLERAARVLGAGPIRAFFAAAFPSLLPSVVAAAVFAFFVSFDELVIAQFLMNGRETLPMRIWADLRLELRPTIAAVSSLLIILTTVAMLLAELLRRRTASLTST
jgi:putative spermidine/putrescine transport system permease protein